MEATTPKRADGARRVLVASRAWPPVLPLQVGRLIDIAVAAAASILLFPLALIVALAILLEGTGPVLFRHRRLGRHGRSFDVFKFRTMHKDGDAILKAHLQSHPAAAAEWARDHKLRLDPRVSRLGRFLRMMSLDEIPQLLNVLRGEMSIVGPRPIVHAEIGKYGRYFGCYCRVRPGITGIWQVSGRNDVSYRRRVAMDAIYSRRKSLALDLRLMLATVPAVLRRRGSY